MIFNRFKLWFKKLRLKIQLLFTAVVGHRLIMELIRLNELKLYPLEFSQIRENGIDLCVSAEYKLLTHPPLDGVANPVLEIPPKTGALLITKEYLKFPDYLAAKCSVKSSWARRGIMVPDTWVDAGFEGKLVLEVFNCSDECVSIHDGEPFCHLVLLTAKGAVRYGCLAGGGRYKGQKTIII